MTIESETETATATDTATETAPLETASMPEHPTLTLELSMGHPTLKIAGVDEVGRGCLAGPVVAGAVILPPEIDYKAHPWLSEINDSKKLQPSVRERLAPLILGWVLAAGIGVATPEEIDQINIHHASHLAMVRAVGALSISPDKILVDGKHVPKGFSVPVFAVVKGDQKSLSIAAASIIAKVWRDQHMFELDQRYPGYGFAQHKGYPTQLHSEALKKQGMTEIHRRSFRMDVGPNPAFERG